MCQPAGSETLLCDGSHLLSPGSERSLKLPVRWSTERSAISGAFVPYAAMDLFRRSALCFGGSCLGRARKSLTYRIRWCRL